MDVYGTRFITRTVVAVVAAIGLMVAGLPGPSSARDLVESSAPGTNWQLPEAPEVDGVGVADLPTGKRPEFRATDAVVKQDRGASWPKPTRERVSIGRESREKAGLPTEEGAPEVALAARHPVGDSPVSVGAPPSSTSLKGTRAREGVPGRVDVQVAGQATSRRLGVDGLVIGLERADKVQAAGEVAVEVDYSGFRQAYGGSWASRLTVSKLTGCDVDEKTDTCNVEPLATNNDAGSGVLAATVPLSGDSSTTLVAVSAEPSGDNGDFTATSLSPAGTWQVSQQTGAFSWSYPLNAVPGLGGPEPDLGLSYSSQRVDGRTANTNSQGSWIGDGWDLWPGYIERKYVSCDDDKKSINQHDPNNKDVDAWDRCWRSDNATMSFNGQSTELVKDSDGTWRGVRDLGYRIEKLTDVSLGNGDGSGEYWRVTSTDGTQYYFGRHRRDGFPDDTAATRSVWTLPVYGNHPGEPCYDSDYSQSRCSQAWRWNLDYVIDPTGNTMTLFYGREIGAYGREADPDLRTTYHRGGYLKRIEYGTREGTDHLDTATARVVFDTENRCLPGETCEVSNPSAWPDVPWDLYCTAEPCTDQLAPAFFTQKRLDEIRTQVWRGGEYTDVESWSLRHEYLDAGASEGEGVPMWLAGVTHTGHVTQAGGEVASDPEITFDAGSLPLANRVEGGEIGRTDLNRWRLKRIWTESGAVLNVNYSSPECERDNLPTPETNQERCYPQWYGPGSQEESLDWFHKYVVDKVTVEDATGASPRMETFYDYLDDPAWAYDESELIPNDRRTWADWRGYSKVRVREGLESGPQSTAEYLYMRGMDGDRLDEGGGTKDVQITDSQGVSIDDHKAHNGFLREETVYNGTDGDWISGTIYTPWLHGPTAVGASSSLKSWMSDTKTVRERTHLEDGTTRWKKTVTSFDLTYGMKTQVSNLGDTSTSADDTCTQFGYVRNTDTWMVDRVNEIETVAAACGETPSRPDDVLSHVRNFYDDADTFGQTPTRGLAVKVQHVDSWNGGTPVWSTVERSAFDRYGRSVSESDALDRDTTKTYTPAVGGPVTAVETTNPMGHTLTEFMEPGLGVPVRIEDSNGRQTEATYDGLGRLTAVWKAGREKSTDSPHLKVSYLLRNDAPSAVTTQTLRPTGGDDAYTTTIDLFDGLLRGRQTQKDAPGGGRVITERVFDSRGLVEWKAEPYYDTSNDPPSTTLVSGGQPQIPGVTEYRFDGAGRQTAEIFFERGSEQWRTTTSYGGDRIHVNPPDGGTATTTIKDVSGRITALRQYHGDTPAGSYDETTYDYSRRGDLRSVTGPAGSVRSYEYDLHGYRVATDDPDAGETVTTYDAAGQVLTTTDANGTTLGYTYDELGRTTSVREGSPSGPKRAEWVYDTLPGGIGMLAESTRFHDGAAYTSKVLGYDETGQPTGTRVVIPDSEPGIAGTYDTTFTYHQDGSPYTITQPAAGGMNSEKLVMSYNDVGAPSWMVSGWSVYVADTYYSKLGDVTQRRLGNFGKRTALSYSHDDATGRLESMSAMFEKSSGPTEVLDLDYSYDDMGNLTRIADSPGSATPEDTQCFRYDYLRRTTDAWTPLSTEADNCEADPGPQGGPARYRYSWQYDKAGNRTLQADYSPEGGYTESSYPDPGQDRPHALTATVKNGPQGTETTGYAYDAAGNMTERTVDGTTQTISWSSEGQVEAITDGDGATEFVYDADGNRLIRRDAEGATLYLGGTEVRYISSTGQTTATRYYSHGGANVAVRTEDELYWMVDDHHGTGTVAIRESDMEYQHRRTAPFGEVRGAEPLWWPGAKGFVGGTDDPTGLTQLGARLYDQSQGRFISVDPLVDLADPQTLNGYAYSNNSPATFTDPNGLKMCETTDCSGGPDEGYVDGNGNAYDRGGELLHRANPPEVKEVVEVYENGTTVSVGPDGTVYINDVAVPEGGPPVYDLAKWVDEVWVEVWGYGDHEHGDSFSVLAAMRTACINNEPECDFDYSVKLTGIHLSHPVMLEMIMSGGRMAGGMNITFVKIKPSGAYKGKSSKSSKSSCGYNSFDGETEVLLADGTAKPISEIEIGDKVLAADPETGEQRAQTVTMVWIHEDTVGDLEIEYGQIITTTTDHPFWNETDREWQRSDTLDIGDELLTASGETATITAELERESRGEIAYNLAVAEIHTYFVQSGDTPVLVHNDILCPRHPQEDVVYKNQRCNSVGTYCPKGTDDTREMVYKRGADGLKQGVKSLDDHGIMSPELTAAFATLLIKKAVDIVRRRL